MSVQKAAAFAAAAHAPLNCRTWPAPYISHPEAVAHAVATRGGIEEQVMAAFLHDVIEDTPVSLAAVQAEFGQRIAEIVDALTRRPGESYPAFIERVAADPDARIVKAADIAHNLADLPEGHSLRRRYERALVALHANPT